MAGSLDADALWRGQARLAEILPADGVPDIAAAFGPMEMLICDRYEAANAGPG
jgi:hypothetical protein